MPRRNYSNTATPQVLTAPVDATAATLSVASTAGYPPVPFLLGLERGTPNEEVALCTATTATSFTVTRGYDGTSGKSHDAGALVEHTVAAIDYRQGSIEEFTTAQRDALTGSDIWAGRVIFNLDTDGFEGWTGTEWGPLGGGGAIVQAAEPVGEDDGNIWYDTDDDLPMGLDDTGFRMTRSGKDANGIFTTIDYFRTDGTKAARSVLSGGTSPTYTTRTVTEYAGDGTTVLLTTTYTNTYDGDGDLTSEAFA